MAEFKQPEGIISNLVHIEYFDDQEDIPEAMDEGVPFLEHQSNKVVKTWLKEIKLDQYYDTFVENGFVSLDLIKNIEDKHTLIDMGIVLRAHQLKLLKEIQSLPSNGQMVLCNCRIPQSNLLCILSIVSVISLVVPLIGSFAIFLSRCFCAESQNRNLRRVIKVLKINTLIGYIFFAYCFSMYISFVYRYPIIDG